ncbi:hypothetical protein M3J09_008991 [Ascochyta lentis]
MTAKENRRQVRSWCCSKQVFLPLGPRQNLTTRFSCLADGYRKAKLIPILHMQESAGDVGWGGWMIPRARLIRKSDTVCEAGDGPRLQMTALAFGSPCRRVERNINGSQRVLRGR